MNWDGALARLAWLRLTVDTGILLKSHTALRGISRSVPSAKSAVCGWSPPNPFQVRLDGLWWIGAPRPGDRATTTEVTARISLA